MPLIQLAVNKGAMGGIDPSLIPPGFLQEAVGVVYAPGDPAARKIPGRTLFNSTAIATQAINGLFYVDFDSAPDRLLAQVNGALYSSTSGFGSFSSIRSSLTSGVTYFDATKYADNLFCCNGTDANWVVLNDNTTINHGLTAITTAPTSAQSATGITGTFDYWTTESDDDNGVESAFSGTALSEVVANKTVTITKPATVNSSATHWNVYRSKDTGSYPIGWRVAQIAIATTTYADTTTDTNLVVEPAYNVVTLNGLSQSQDTAPPVFRSMATFEGSICGLNGRSLHFSETNAPHSMPASHAIAMRPIFGGIGNCVREVNGSLVVLFDHDAFRINWLPKQLDSTFDSDVAQEHVSNFGTPSPRGAVRFAGWGGTEMLFFVSRSGPMLTDGEVFNRAVQSIGWASIFTPETLDQAVVIDNPDLYRIECYAPLAGVWYRVDFYYDADRLSQGAPLPRLAWTGPHRVPGPGTFGVVGGSGRVWTGSRASDGKVYTETGTSDAANLIDSSGTVQFRLNPPRIYPAGLRAETTATDCGIHKESAGTGTYDVTVTGYHEAGLPSQGIQRNIPATTQGDSSADFQVTGRGFDMRVVRDDTASMPPINNILFEVEDTSAWEKPG